MLCVSLFLFVAHLVLTSAAAPLQFDFFGNKECDPVQLVLSDPRAKSLATVIRANRLDTLFFNTWRDKAGTVVLPTSLAFDNLLDDLDVNSLTNLTSAVSNATWSRVLPSYFLTNTSYLPKDFVNQVYQTAGSLFLYASPYRNNTSDTLTSVLLRYVDITSTLIRPSGQQPVANVVAYGKPALVTDFSLVCDQYVVYWLDAVLLPFSDLCGLTREGCATNTSLSSLVNVLQGNGQRTIAPAPAPSRSGR